MKGQREVVCLMYHELEVAGRNPCRTDSGYTRYVVREEQFSGHLNAIRAAGFMGIGIGDFLRADRLPAPAVAITFDDGCETDLTAGAPGLGQLGFRGTFYVVAGWIGTRGFLSKGQLRELAGGGFEIGCHSMTHPDLTTLTRRDLLREVRDAKQNLEQILGAEIEHFSCPGGRWNAEVVQIAKSSGYRSLATSRIGSNQPNRDLFRLARVAVFQNTGAADVVRSVRGEGLLLRRTQQLALTAAKGLLGKNFVERLRGALYR